MKKITVLSILAMLLLTVWVSAAHAKTAAELLREGLYAEEVEGNLDAAIGIYEQVASDSTAARNLVAQALYRQGMCLLKKKNEAQAQAVFQKLVTNYADQTQIVEKVRPMLEELGNADPASLMPPETLMYVEIGSPGRQVETILNMLKDTPLENPLAAIHQGGSQMLGALLNPSMLAEFKKIRGIGIGITDLTQQNPAAVVVLFPGKSDALRGLIHAALGMLGRPRDMIAGMQVVGFADGGGAAFDDTVIIATTPSPRADGLLQWAVKQYKGQTRLPSLASHNNSFSKISKQARQQNAMTLWMNVDEAYGRLGQMLPPDQIPQQIRMADGLVDFQNVEDLIASLSLRETGVALEANVNLKEGHQSQVYNLIRTPRLSTAALKAVPSDAVALISMTLGEAGSAQAQAADKHIKGATGLDIASQIFGNIEQVMLFAVPQDESVSSQASPIPPIATSVALAMTARNPQQVQGLLMTLLKMASLVPADSEQTLPTSGRCEIALANGPTLLGNTDPASKTMVFSLNPGLIETSVTALKQNRSITDGGKLQDALATLSPTTSKLVLVNVAGLLRLVAQNATFGSDATAQRARKALDELAKVSEKTSVRLQTGEEANSFHVRLSVSDLPPAGQIIGPLMELSQVIAEAKRSPGGPARQAMPGTQGQPPISIAPAARPPAIDGNLDDVWAGAASYAITRTAYTPASGEEDFSAGFQTLYDSQGLYVLVDVADDRLVNDSGEFWLDDGVEVFVDADNSKSGAYGDNDYQYHFNWDAAAPTMGEAHHNKTGGVQFAFARTDKGYRAEIKLPWSTLGVQPAVGMRIGLDVHVNDDDGDGGDRGTKLMWNAKEDNSYQDPRLFGTAELAGLVGWWRLDEATGTMASDSSGNGHGAAVRGNPAWRPTGGKVGGAIALDGDGDYLEVADESAFDFAAGVTVAAWVRADRLDKLYQAVVTKGEWAWRIQRNEQTNMLEFACSGVQVPAATAYGSLYGTREISIGEWHHIVGTYDGRRMALYVDGSLDTAQAASGPISTDDDPVLIGENAAERNRFWAGLIDDVRLYNYGIPEAQVRELYSQGR